MILHSLGKACASALRSAHVASDRPRAVRSYISQQVHSCFANCQRILGLASHTQDIHVHVVILLSSASPIRTLISFNPPPSHISTAVGLSPATATTRTCIFAHSAILRLKSAPRPQPLADENGGEALQHSVPQPSSAAGGGAATAMHNLLGPPGKCYCYWIHPELPAMPHRWSYCLPQNMPGLPGVV